MVFSFRTSLMVGLSFVCMLMPVHAFAQQTTPAPSEPPAAKEAAGDEIVVTANKRSENINKVGLTIAAVSGQALAERKISSLSDLAAVVPGLAFSPSPTNTPIYTLRGVGFNESSLGVYPAVSVYIDQAPLPFPVLASHSAYDLERVEVLKGPQGTLFGQNSTGGAINYIAAQPTSTFTAGGDISYGRFNQVDGNAFVSGPITDNLLFRVAVNGLRSDDWQRSITRDDTNGHQLYYAGRFLLNWQATDGIKLSLNANGWVDKSQPQAAQLIAIRTVGAEAPAGFLSQPFVPNSPRLADWTDMALDPATGVVDPNTGATAPGTAKSVSFDPFSNRKFYQLALRADIDLTDDLTLTSLTSYDHFNQHQRTDGDGSATLGYDLQRSDGYIRSFNQEIRIANSPTNPLRYIVGGNYEHSTTYENQLLRLLNSNSNAGTLFINAAGVTNKQRIENIAAFGNVEYSVADKVTIKAGARYTHSSNRSDICPYSGPNGNVDKLFNLLGAVFGSVPFTPITEADCYALNENLVPGERFQDRLKEHNVSWRVGVDYQVTPTTLIYGNVSRGYKAGSFPTLAASTFSALAPVKQESVTSYEAGVKTQFFDRKVGLNAAAFYYDYRDKQIRGRLIDTPNIFGPLETLVNIPKSRIYGAEADLTLRPFDGLVINGAITYLNSKVQEGAASPRNYNILGEVDSSIGDPLPFTPKFSGVVNVDYRLRTSGGTPFVGFTVSARSSSDAALGGHRLEYPASATTVVRPGVKYPFAIDGYATVDGRIGYESDDGWRVMFWAKNLFNKYYWTTVLSASDSAARLAGMPATYGVTAGVKFQ
ncbi:TonB-dependent receptor precursor [Novosphingobium resinovorum]|uniref:TonB-dependent receptor n=1 Tax=Novosphingobium resinovorum TaxID=158500 RepID=A0A031JSG0_9SPHN|nr:TonB-dependent receptor [Novosphingobium resinovorum]EZP79302.1 TonB-dependent receptor precursor [Novosphingobium resinovorum]